MAAATSAVYVKDAYKHYGPKSGPKRKDVLDGLCMRVHRGSIYGLLGASGCGKTTLLSCIVGRKLLNGGELWVLGGTPGTKGSGVPGPRVGYMPQEVALIAEFTVKGIVFYFGRIFGMSEKQITSRFKELSTLLDLPPDDRMVGNCSGGQQRRISFAAAMIHDPELLILDEPTVGLDPVLRERIWEYLVNITSEKNISVIITTHYIEECRQATTIGLMRQGNLLAEESPANLLIQYQTDTLEDVFLELSKQQAEGRLTIKTIEEGPPEESKSTNDLNTISVAGSFTALDTTTGSTNNILKNTMSEKLKKKKNNQYSPFVIKWDRFLALFLKNWIQYFKNTGGLVFTGMFPLVQMTVFFLAIGADPKELKIAIVNDANGNCSNFDVNKYVHFNNDSECEFTHLSCKLIQEMDDPMIIKVFYDDLEKAITGISKGDIYGTMYFPSNYSQSTRDRVLEGKDATDDIIEAAEVKVWLDMSSQQVGPILKTKLYRIYRDFQKGILKTCNYNPQVGEIPINFKDPIYGLKDDEFTVFVMPGFLVTVVFFVATMMTSTVLITERLEGVWDRTLVAGATAMELLVTHIITQFTIIIFQIIETLVISLYIFKMELIGDLTELMMLMFAIGFTGMCYGFLVSIYCVSHSQANFAATGSFYPMLMISGIMWPVEGMPAGLSFIAHCFPFTIPVQALRNIMRKGFHTSHPTVLYGYGICGGWSLFFILMSFYLLKIKM